MSEDTGRVERGRFLAGLRSPWVIAGVAALGCGAAVLALAALRANGSDTPSAQQSATPAEPSTAAVYGGHSPLCVEVVDDPVGRSRGLSGRDALGPYDGMLFLFPGEEPARRGFWMKDTRFALDLVTVGVDGKVLEVLRMEPCSEEDCPLYLPEHPFLYALELPAGTADDFELRAGTEVSIRGGCIPIDRE